jgi:hypothetical protein
MMLKKLMRIALRYSLLGGPLAFVLVVVMYYMGRHPMLTSPFLDFRILLFSIFVFFTLREFRDYEQQGVLYFSQAMIGGQGVILLMSMLTAVLVLCFGMFEPRFVSDYITQVTAYVKTFSTEDIARIGKETYERNLQALPSTNITNLAVTYFVHGVVIGFFVNILLSVILRKQPKT